MRKTFSPDAADGAAPLAKKTSRPNKFDSDADFASVATSVSTKWSATPAITLLWTNAATLAQQLTDWKAFYQDSSSGRSKKSSKASVLQQLDKDIAKGLSFVKGYVDEKFGKTLAKPEYYRYGFIKKSSGYIWSADRDVRMQNLDLVIAAIAADGFGSKTYGTTFWTTLKADYMAAMAAAKDNTSSTTVNTGNKNELKKAIAKTLKCLRLVLEANYPDTAANVIREWGWQKETY